MARVYSTRLFIAHAITTGTLVVDSGDLAVIRCLTSFYPGPVLGGSLQLVDGDTDATIYFQSTEALGTAAFIIEPDVRIILPPGSTTHIINASVADVALFGYLLTLP